MEIRLTVRHIYKERDGEVAETIRVEQPKIETEIKIGNTTYIVGGYFASEGVTVSEKIKKMLNNEIVRSNVENASKICTIS